MPKTVREIAEAGSRSVGKLEKAGVKAKPSACNVSDKKQVRPLEQSRGITPPQIENSPINKVKDQAELIQTSDLNQITLGIHSVHNDRNCLYAEAQVKEQFCRMLIDTGSPVSIIAYADFLKLGLEEMSLQKIETSLTTVDGNKLDVKGYVTLEFRMNSLKFEQGFVVAALDNLSGILGMDFLERYEGDIQINRQMLKTSQGKVNLFKHKTYSCARIRLQNKVVVPANSETFLECRTDRCFSDPIGIVEPIKSLSSRGAIVAKSLVQPTNDKIILSVLNLGKKDLSLEQDSVIGTVSAVVKVVKEDDIQSEDRTDSELPTHLKPLIENSSKELTENQRESLKQLVNNFQDVFIGEDGSFGQTNIATHKIETHNAPPIKIPARRVPLAKKETVEKEVKKMLEQGIIEPSDSPWSSPVCLVTKKDGTCRFCIDFRKLNTVTQKDAYPLPRIDDTLETLSGAKWFSTLDLASGYWQVKMNPKDKPKTAFTTHLGLFHFNVMPFGLSNAPATFERLMNSVLGSLKWKKCLCYLDDVIVFGSDFNTAIENLRSVFTQFRLANLKLKPKKCVLFQSKVTFLGHVVSHEGIQCDPNKTKSIEHWPCPVSRTEVRSFLGLVGYYRRFVPNFSEIASPLTRLTRKRVAFHWDDACEQAFNSLKQSLLTAPILSFPENEGMFILDTDASAFGLGAVLSQIQGQGEEKVLAYASRTLNPAQKNYCTTKRELLAVVTFLKQFRHFLYGQKFLLRTDHAPLIWLKNFKDPEGMLARWLSVIETYNFEIQYRPGPKHTNADALSRKPLRKCKNENCPECQVQDSLDNISRNAEDCEQTSPLGLINESLNSNCEQSALLVNPILVENIEVNSESDHSCNRPVANWLPIWTRDELLEMQKKDLGISPILNNLLVSADKLPISDTVDFNSDAKSLWTQWDLLKIENNLLYRRKETKTGEIIFQLVAPKAIRNMIFEHLHANRTAGHFGRDKTLESIKRRFYWPGMCESVKRWCKSCELCAQCKSGPSLGKSPLRQFVVRAPLECTAIDIMGPLPETRNGNIYIMVVGDYYTKWKEAFALPNHTALTVADKLVTEVFTRIGCPVQIHSDQGREFESELFSNICKLLGIQKTRTTPYHPQSDGLVERFNRTLRQMLSMFVDKNMLDWDDHLPYLLMAYRASEHKSTKCSPNLMMLGREISCPLDIMVGEPPGTNSEECPVVYVQWLKDSMQDNFNFANEQLGVAAKAQKRNYACKSKPREINIGSWVWRWYPPKAGQKLGLGWTGPYLVVDKISQLTCKIQKDKTSKSINVHIDHLKPYDGESPPLNWLETVVELSVPNPSLVSQQSRHLENETDSFSDDESLDKNVNSYVRTRTGRLIQPRDVYSP